MVLGLRVGVVEVRVSERGDLYVGQTVAAGHPQGGYTQGHALVEVAELVSASWQ